MSSEGISTIEVRGHSRLIRPASLFLRFLAGFFDVFVGLCLIACAYGFFGLDPLLDWKLAPMLGAAVLVPWAIARAVQGASIGESVWKTREGKAQAVRDPSDNLSASLLTLGAICAAILIFFLRIAAHPYWVRASQIGIQPTSPPQDWRVLSFYYTLAPWPVSLDGKPIFYSIPYEVGPPRRFLGHIQSEWVKDSVRVQFEGPKTPMEYQSRARSRESLRECFMLSPIFSPGCIEARRLTLERHLRELRDLGYAKFEVTWFSAENPAIPERERAQGVLLRARAGKKTEDRYILITPQGVHQSIALSYLDNAEDTAAEAAFRVAIGDLRISEDLGQGRVWTDSLLQSTKLRDLSAAESPSYLLQLSQIQAILIAKLTVDPDSFDAYYHLAGSYLLLLKYTVKHPDPELRALAQEMVSRMNRFAHDVGSRNPSLESRLRELDQLEKDAKQF